MLSKTSNISCIQHKVPVFFYTSHSQLWQTQGAGVCLKAGYMSSFQVSKKFLTESNSAKLQGFMCLWAHILFPMLWVWICVLKKYSYHKWKTTLDVLEIPDFLRLYKHLGCVAMCISKGVCSLSVTKLVLSMPLTLVSPLLTLCLQLQVLYLHVWEEHSSLLKPVNPQWAIGYTHSSVI